MVTQIATAATNVSGTIDATAFSTQRKIDRTSDGTVWAMFAPNTGSTVTFQIMNFWYSKNGGSSWTDGACRLESGSGNGGGSYTTNASFFIDLDDYAHVVFKDPSNGYLYYRRGTLNTAKTSWTWSAATILNNGAAGDYPNIVVFRDPAASGAWRGAVVFSSLSGTTNYAVIIGITISSTGVVATQDIAPSLVAYSSPSRILGGSYLVGNHTWPTIDFNHTGDGKAVAGGTPHLYVGWSSGRDGSGYGIRFRKGTYSGGSWSWGAERQIDPAAYPSNAYYSLFCMFDGTRVMFTGMLYEVSGDASSGLLLYERDAADTTTIVHSYIPSAAAPGRTGSATWDASGNIHYFGRGGTSSPYDLVYYKWTRATDSWSYSSFVSAISNIYPYVSVKRGFSGSKIEFIYTDGSANPYYVTYGNVVINNVPTAPTNLSVPSTANKTDLVTVTYTHNDPDGDPQAKTQARWRKAVV